MYYTGHHFLEIQENNMINNDESGNMVTWILNIASYWTGKLAKPKKRREWEKQSQKESAKTYYKFVNLLKAQNYLLNSIAQTERLNCFFCLKAISTKTENIQVITVLGFNHDHVHGYHQLTTVWL